MFFNGGGGADFTPRVHLAVTTERFTPPARGGALLLSGEEVGQRPGCCQISCNAQGSVPQQDSPKALLASRLTNPD